MFSTMADCWDGRWPKTEESASHHCNPKRASACYHRPG